MANKFSWGGGGGIRRQTNSLLRDIVRHSLQYYRIIHMLVSRFSIKLSISKF